MIVPVIAAVVSGIALLAIAATLGGRIAESDRIQHGIESAAVVTGSRVELVRSRWGDYHETFYNVAFTNPNGGRQVHTTIKRVHVNDRTAKGRIVNIRFDPATPTRAEFPGHPEATRSEQRQDALLGVALLVLSGVLVVRSRSKTQRRRGVRWAGARGMG